MGVYINGQIKLLYLDRRILNAFPDSLFSFLFISRFSLSKVRKLEQQNKVLETQLKLLKGKDQYKSNVGRIMTAHSQPLKQQIDMLNQDKMKLQNELDQTQTFLEELKSQ